MNNIVLLHLDYQTSVDSHMVCHHSTANCDSFVDHKGLARHSFQDPNICLKIKKVYFIERCGLSFRVSDKGGDYIEGQYELRKIFTGSLEILEASEPPR
jgi:hypothetical protein